MAASARPMASVVLPEPPFWVAKTIVCIDGPLDSFEGFCGYATRSRNRILRCRAIARSDLPSPIQRPFGIAVVRISNIAMMPDYRIVAIPYEYLRSSANGLI